MSERLVHDFSEYVDRRGSDCKKYNPGQYGEDVLPMWIADTDFKVPAPVAEAARARAAHEAFGYPYELPEFNQSVKHWMKVRHGWDIEEGWIEFVTGVVPAAIFAIRAFTNAGDKVLVQTPLYSPLREAVVDNGRHLITSPFIENDGYYSIDFKDFEKKLSDPRTRMFILCNPHNPVGRVFTEEELTKIGELCIKHNVIVFNDEIHADIVYKGHKHIAFAGLSEEIADITITSLNPGKTFNVAGVRTAAVIISNKDLMNRFIIERKNAKGMGRTVFGQNVFIACYKHGEYYADQLVEYLEDNLDYVYNYIKENIPQIKFRKPEGLYLLWLDCRGLELSQDELVKLFTEKGKIGLNSGTSFGVEGTGFMRLNIAVPRVTLEEGLKRVKTAVDSLNK